MKCITCKKSHDEITKTCGLCKEYQRQYREENKEKARQRYEENREEIIEKQRQYNETNREEINEYQQQYCASAHGKFIHIQNGARKRNLPFELSEDFVGEKTDEPCFYCGEETTFEKRNGLDRLANTVGYTENNVVSCCGTCNNMKQCVDPLTFIERCAQVSLQNGHEGRTTEYWNTIKGYTYSKYKSHAKIDFELTEYQYDKLRKGNCVYCGRGSVDGHTNGIDRVNNDIGYILGNCVSCCGDCNFAKGSSTVEDFIAKCVMIASRMHDIPEGIERQVKMIKRR